MQEGRPPKFRSAKKMQELIDAYFEECKGELLKDDNGNVMFDKFGQPIVIDNHPPTVVGLALALGFTSRQSLLNYQGKDEFVDTITRAKARIEQYAEERLFDNNGTKGAQFSLKCNFGWKDKDDSTVQAEPIRVIITPRNGDDNAGN